MSASSAIPTGKFFWSFPPESWSRGEDPFEAMKREQREETGTTAETYVSLGNIYPTPGYAGEIIRLWACRLTRDEGTLHLDEGEFLTNERIPLQQAVEWCCKMRSPTPKPRSAF